MPYSGKYFKKLIGEDGVEDALKRLDRLTQEEARMAAAQLLKVTNTIGNTVGGIADNVLVVHNIVAGIDDASVDECVAYVDDHLKDVDGAQYIFNQLSKLSSPNVCRWKRGQGGYPTNS